LEILLALLQTEGDTVEEDTENMAEKFLVEGFSLMPSWASTRTSGSCRR
jgi:hypothetical protein